MLIPITGTKKNGQYYWELHKKYNEYVKDSNTRIFGPDPNAEEQREIAL